ncbi:MAG: hypothetical protein BYD32DRAFT_461119 [Podila humilis]|nr:MAG: hypothetical protein BYD32DRAFT_461119 [Podila humilis]
MFLILAGMEVKTLVTNIDSSITVWLWLYNTVVAIPFVLMKSFREVARTSTLGAFATLVLIVDAVRGLILDFHNPIYAHVHHNIVVSSHLSTAVATISICFGGNAIYLHVEESMRYPKSWNRVVAATCLVLGRLHRSWNQFIISHVIFTAPIPLSSFALEIERLTDITIIRRGNVIYRTIIRSAIIEACGYAKLLGWRHLIWYELAWCALIVALSIVNAIIESI